MKKYALTAILLVLVLLLSSCGDTSDSNQPNVSLSALQYEIENQVIDFNDMWFYQELEEKTGTHVDFDVVKDSDWTNRVSLMFASGQYHDMVLRGSLEIEDYGVTQHLVLPLDQYLAECMPIYSARMQESGVSQLLRASDGQMYYVGFLLSQGINTNGHFFINKTWLDALGLDIPTTTEELTEVLRAFKNGDPNGNGIADELPYEATFDDVNTGLYNAMSAFGVPMNEYLVHVSQDGQVLFAPEEEGFRACAEWLHMLCMEGLLDVESLTQGSNLWAAKVNQNRVGYFSYWRLLNTAIDPAVAKNYVLMQPVSAPGEEAVVCRLSDMMEFGASLTIQNQHVEESLRWLDAQMETETMLVSQNGKLGDTLMLRDDGRYEVAYVPAGNELYQTVPVICGQFFAPEEYYDSVYVPAAHRQEKSGYCQTYEDAGVLEDIPYTTLVNATPITSEESARIRQLYTQLRSAVNARLVEFITRGVTDESYAQFLAELHSIGSDEYVALYQTAYNRYTEGNAGQ